MKRKRNKFTTFPHKAEDSVNEKISTLRNQTINKPIKMKVDKREKDYLVSIIRNLIIQKKWNDASKFLTTLAHSPYDYELIIYQLGIEIMTGGGFSFQQILRFHSIMLEIVDKNKENINLFINEIILNICNMKDIDITTLYIKICSKFIDTKSSSSIVIILRGIFEYVLWKITDEHKYMKLSIEHLSQILKLDHPFIPYLDIYWKLLYHSCSFDVLHQTLIQCTNDFPSSIYFIEIILQEDYINLFSESEICDVLFRLKKVDVLNQNIEAKLFPYLEKGFYTSYYNIRYNY